MTGIKHYEQAAGGANFFPDIFQFYSQYIIPEMALACIIYRVIFAFCIVGYEGLVIAIGFITIIVLDLLSMPGKMKIYDIACM